MSLTNDIIAAHLRPKTVLRAHFLPPVNEVLTLSLALIAAFLVLIAALPYLRIEALAEGVPFSAFLLPAALASLGLLPIIFLLLGTIEHGCLRLMGFQSDAAAARRGLVLAVLVAMPWNLIASIANAYLKGPFPWLLSMAALGVFIWQWITGFMIRQRVRHEAV